MAAYAVREIADAFFCMFLLDFIPVVASVTGPAAQAAGVAILTGIGSTVVHGEVMRPVIPGRQPGAGGMAVLASGAKLTCVNSWLLVAGNAGAGRTFVAAAMA